LLNHIDVVPAKADEWSVHPFGGEVKDGFIYGRGALDMKSLGIMEMLAFLEVKRQGLTPCRDLIFLAVADEEAGGRQGVQYLLDQNPDDFQADLVLNEGGFGLNNVLSNRPLFMFAISEKGVCQIRLTSTGPPGHGSTPHGDNALEKLVKALNRVLSGDNPIIVTPQTAEYFKQLGTEWDFLKSYLEDGKTATLIDALTGSGMMGIPQISAMLRNTISLNILKSGDKSNVIPSKAQAVLVIRLLPGTEPDAFIAEVKKRLEDENIGIEPLKKSSASKSPMDTDDFATIKNVHMAHYPNALTVASLLFGASDSRFFRSKGIPCYGVCPMLASLEEFNRVHGIDERVSVESLLEGTRVYTDMVKTLCRI
jgi:acetylornithine deacetylase/succinyl-diaminopimelate desuccinylase-like protein